jgi:hypothetical protein
MMLWYFQYVSRYIGHIYKHTFHLLYDRMHDGSLEAKNYDVGIQKKVPYAAGYCSSIYRGDELTLYKFTLMPVHFHISH